MLENYLISITGRQEIDGEQGEINLTTYGSYTLKGHKKFIVYKEYPEDNAPPITAVLKVDKDLVTLMHTSDTTRLILEKGQRHLCQYDTGVGSLMVGIFTQELESSLPEPGGELKLHYTMDINSVLSSKNEISVTVKEAKQPCQ